MCDDEDTLLATAASAATLEIVTDQNSLSKNRKRRKRTVRMRPLFQRRHQRGAYNVLMAELRHVKGKDKHAGFLRMCPNDFDYLLSLVNEDITGLARYRLPIPADA